MQSLLGVDEAKQYVQQQPIVGADETSFKQGNIDGCFSIKESSLAMRRIRPLVTFFEIALTRCTSAAKNLLGENFAGILNSDRHGAYNWVDLERRQLCWAHLRREFIKISERPGTTRNWEQHWLNIRKSCLSYGIELEMGLCLVVILPLLVQDIRLGIKTLLQQTADYEIGSKEKTHDS